MRIAALPSLLKYSVAGVIVVIAAVGSAHAQSGPQGGTKIDCSKEIVFNNGWTLEGLRAVREACAHPAGATDGKGIRRINPIPVETVPAIRSVPARPIVAPGGCPGRMEGRTKEPTPAGRHDVAFTFKFGANVDTVPPVAMNSLIVFRKYLSEYFPNGTIDIVGHADASGNDDMNDALSQRRAENAVKVIADGDPELGRRLRAVGGGARELRPDVAPCDESQRRIEARIPL